MATNSRAALTVLFVSVWIGCGYDELLIELDQLPEGTRGVDITAEANGRTYRVSPDPSVLARSFDAVPRTYRLDIKKLLEKLQTKDVLLQVAALNANGCKISYGRGLASGRRSIDLLSAISVPLTEYQTPQCPLRVKKRGFGAITSIPAGINCPAECEAGADSASWPQNVDCETACSADFASGTTVTLTPTPRLAVEWLGAPKPTGELVLPMDHGVLLNARIKPGACSADDICTYAPITQGQDLVAASADGLGGAWLVGQGGTALYYDGQQLTVVPTGSPVELRGVAAKPGTRVVWAVGRLGTVRRFDGNAWTPIDSGTTATLNAVWAANDDEETVWAVGDNGIVLRFSDHGSRRRQVRLEEPPTAYNGVWGSSASDVWIVGQNGSVLRRESTASEDRFSRQTSPVASPLRGIWGIGERVFIVGDGGVILSRSGIMLNRETLPAQFIGANFVGVWGQHQADVWAAGSNGALVHYDGLTWSSASPPTPLGLNAGFSTSDGKTVVAGQAGIALVSSGKEWTDAKGLGGNLSDVWGISDQDLWAVGDDRIVHYSRGSFSIVQRGVGNLRRIFARTPTDVWAVGDGGAVLHFDGSKWTPVVGIPQVALRDIWAAGAEDAWTVGGGGVLFHWDGRGWNVQPSRTVQDLNGVWGAAGNDMWVVGDHGTALHYDGVDFVPTDTGTDETLLSVWGAVGRPVFASGSRGTILSYQGQWLPMDSGSQTSLSRLTGTVIPGQGDAEAKLVLWAVGSEGTLLRSDGRSFVALDSNSTSWFAGAWVHSDHSAWFVGTGSAVARFMPSPSPPVAYLP